MNLSHSYRVFDEGPFWKTIPAFRDLDNESFLNAAWQARNSVRSIEQLSGVLGDLVTGELIADMRRGLGRAPMSIRLTPYILARIDWSNPTPDPIRRQFLPLASEQEPDHPAALADSLQEQACSPVPGIIRRYPDKALFVAVNTCPVYCSFCTRSYSVGVDTPLSEKSPNRTRRMEWPQALAWLAENVEIEDVVISGGDAFHLSPEALRFVGQSLLAMSHIRRIRIATKGLAVLPSRFSPHDAWAKVLTELVSSGRDRDVAVALHTHFNHPTEISWVTRDAARFLFSEGITVRNQSVLIRGVNDRAETMSTLVKLLGHLHIQPYYVYLHDIVSGMETYRTSLQLALDLEKAVRGTTAGFLTPTFVVDLPGGGGKRDIHSFESYDRVAGISYYRSPNIDPDRVYQYLDPIRN